MTVQERTAGGPAFAAVLTVCDTAGTSTAQASLEFLEPGWGVAPLAQLTAGQRRLLVQVDDAAALGRLIRAARQCAQVLDCVDQLWAMSAGGRLEVRPRLPARSAEDVLLAYTPGVTRLAAAIAARPDTAAEVTGRPNPVAVIADGTTVRISARSGRWRHCRSWRARPRSWRIWPASKRCRSAADRHDGRSAHGRASPGSNVRRNPSAWCRRPGACRGHPVAADAPRHSGVR